MKPSTNSKQFSGPDIQWQLHILSQEGLEVGRLTLEEGPMVLTGQKDQGDYWLKELGQQVVHGDFDGSQLTLTVAAGPSGFTRHALVPGQGTVLHGIRWLVLKTKVQTDVGSKDSLQDELLTHLVHWLAKPMPDEGTFQAAIVGLLDIMVKKTEALNASLILCEQRGARIFAHSGNSLAQAQHFLQKVPADLLQRILRDNIKVILPEELRSEPKKSASSLTIFLQGIPSIVALPVRAELRVHAILLIQMRSLFQDFDQSCQSRFEAIAELLGLVFQRAYLREQIQLSNQRLDLQTLETGGHQRLMIGRSRALDQVYTKLQKYALTPIPVLLTGETGTGKELAAKEIHRFSSRANGPFIPFNSATIPEHLLEAELFGYRKGAFTGAAADRIGLFEMADKGSLFLDEIGEMSLALQAKILRILQEKQLNRLGEERMRKIDFRLICATHRDLEAMVRAGTFREDLYYRIAGALITLPPLRHRPEDIALLAHYFKNRFVHLHQLPERDFSYEALATLCHHAWPGNIRQLQHVVETAVVVAEDTCITADNLSIFVPKDMPLSDSPQASLERPNLGNSLSEAKSAWLRGYLTQMLDQHQWNRSLTAKSLGIGQRTLFRYLEQLKIQEPHPTSASIHHPNHEEDFKNPPTKNGVPNHVH
jgi:transcriptional regulator with GAF, ATPase, and Fis domain